MKKNTRELFPLFGFSLLLDTEAEAEDLFDHLKIFYPLCSANNIIGANKHWQTEKCLSLMIPLTMKCGILTLKTAPDSFLLLICGTLILLNLKLPATDL